MSPSSQVSCRQDSASNISISRVLRINSPHSILVPQNAMLEGLFLVCSCEPFLLLHLVERLFCKRLSVEALDYLLLPGLAVTDFDHQTAGDVAADRAGEDDSC